MLLGGLVDGSINENNNDIKIISLLFPMKVVHVRAVIALVNKITIRGRHAFICSHHRVFAFVILTSAALKVSVKSLMPNTRFDVC